MSRSREDARRGLVLVYTGNGKGKTTAALGAALRAVGHGTKVLMVQFMKGNPRYGELLAARRYLSENLEVVQSGLDRFVDRENPSEEDLTLAARGLDIAGEALSSGRYGMVILDEINVAVDYGLLDAKDVLQAVRERDANVDVILTGRYAPAEFVEEADTASEMRELKHHYHQGTSPCEGIEY